MLLTFRNHSLLKQDSPPQASRQKCSSSHISRKTMVYRAKMVMILPVRKMSQAVKWEVRKGVRRSDKTICGEKG